jgi:hypothetical protein
MKAAPRKGMYIRTSGPVPDVAMGGCNQGYDQDDAATRSRQKRRAEEMYSVEGAQVVSIVTVNFSSSAVFMVGAGAPSNSAGPGETFGRAFPNWQAASRGAGLEPSPLSDREPITRARHRHRDLTLAVPFPAFRLVFDPFLGCIPFLRPLSTKRLSTEDELRRRVCTS